MEHFTFEQLPQALSLLHEKINRIERLLTEQQPLVEKEMLLNVSQAAAFLHLSVATLYTKVSCREVPFSKRGKRLYFRKSELEEWVRQGRRKTVSEIRQEAVQKASNNGRKRK
ncbi:helix-turn-helix domain-containing protein [Pontibacter qinzhouensis]|uniref:Helix-turn-helix domain-containing protein n=1 Tax=Pontibacter qinzhouensis TaxID=2603253 RepID=A0A5C8K7N1_9BACT|nr:helix-turn-helix domain-containing protein [Pontibacter qinzhouensis]TXK45826.1 helix-turn-helix domain-containing protein [Pontibacter qinzhouensis]